LGCSDFSESFLAASVELEAAAAAAVADEEWLSLSFLLDSFLMWLGMVSVAARKFLSSLSFIFSCSFFWRSRWLDFRSLLLDDDEECLLLLLLSFDTTDGEDS
jgi:hypothetical protein